MVRIWELKFLIKNKKNQEVYQKIIIGEKFTENKKIALILGDNFFYGQNLTEKLISSAKLTNGAKVLLHVQPELFALQN